MISIPSAPPDRSQERTAERGRRRFSKKRLFLAFLIACVSDIVGALVTWVPPAVWALDLATAIALFIVLGWSWLLLPGLVLEAIPGLEILPFWVLVVGAVAIFGDPRPRWK